MQFTACLFHFGNVMSKEKRKGNKFPHVKGLAKKRTKFGHRWILTEQDSMGKSRSITVKILDTDTEDVFYRKVADARMELRRKDKEKSFESFFRDYCVINQLSQKTIRKYRCVLKDFSFSEKSNNDSVRRILQSGLKSTTISHYMDMVNRFFDFCIKRGAPTSNPAQDIRIKCRYVPRMRIATENELQALIKYARKRSPEYRLFIMLLIETGARISTISALKAADFKDGYLSLYNVKCKKPYDYLMPIKNNEIIDLWINVSKDGVLWHKDPLLYERRLRTWMYANFAPDSNGERLSPHSLRHTFASHAVQNGVSIDVVSKLLDHSSSSVTLKVYARFSQSQIDDAVEKATKKPT